MRLTVFHVGDGDCLLLTAQATDGNDDKPHHILVDGGRKTPFRDNAGEFLGKLRERGEELAVVCVSHIDDDHISGILGMIEDEVAWRVFDLKQKIFEEEGGREPEKPDPPRPPVIREIWHNALFELVGDELEVEVHGALATSARVLAGSELEVHQELASQLDNLATGERSALELSRRISSHQLNIPRNRPPGHLMQRGGPADQVQIGPLNLRLLGPSEDDIEKLRKRWARWIRKNKKALGKLRRELSEDERDFGSGAADIVLETHSEGELGQGASGVSEPNLASLMFLVEEPRAEGEPPKTVLLTGDGVSDEILEGLEFHGKLDDDQRIHVDVLKVQHHGALANITRDFVQQVSADHYLFCGNGAHHNPELVAITEMAYARLKGIDGGNPVGPDRPFKFWFTSSPETPKLSDKRKEHMGKVRELLERLETTDAKIQQAKRAEDGAEGIPERRFSFEMLRKGLFEFEI